MLSHVVLLIQAAAAPIVQGSNAPAFDVPRLTDEVEVDGRLAEATWTSAIARRTAIRT